MGAMSLLMAIMATCSQAIADNTGKVIWDHTGYQAMPQDSASGHAGVDHRMYGDVNADTDDVPNTSHEAHAIEKMSSFSASRPNAIAVSNGTATWDYTGFSAMSQESTLEHAAVFHRRYGDDNADTYEDLNTHCMDCGLVEVRHQYPSSVSPPDATVAIADSKGTATWEYTGYQAMPQDSTSGHAGV
jgi:hypothetical protein